MFSFFRLALTLHLPQLHNFRVDRQIYSYYNSLFNMVHIKLSMIAFILAAAAIAPVVALPAGTVSHGPSTKKP